MSGSSATSEQRRARHGRLFGSWTVRAAASRGNTGDAGLAHHQGEAAHHCVGRAVETISPRPAIGYSERRTSHSVRYVVKGTLTEPNLFASPGCQFAERFSEGSRQLCRPILRLPAAIAVRHLLSPVASRTFTPAVASASRAAARTAVPHVKHNVIAATPRIAVTDHPVRIAAGTRLAASALRARCSLRLARRAAKRRRCHFNPVVTSPSIARPASSSAEALDEARVATAGAATSGSATAAPAAGIPAAARRRA